MKNSLKAKVAVLLLVLIGITSCNAQVKSNTSPDRNREPGILTKVQQKIPKPRGINPNPIIGCSMQDKLGNVWFTSNGEGIYRYDGNSFRNFTMSDGLDTNVVYSIMEDNLGAIWIGTCRGLNRYDGKTFEPIRVTSTMNNRVWSIVQDRKGTIWIGSDEGVFCYRPDKTKLGVIQFAAFLDDTTIHNPDKLRLRATFSILEDRTGAIWFGTCVDEGISRFDGKNLVNLVPQKDVGRVNRLVQDEAGSIWCSTTRNSICQFQGESFTKMFLRPKKVIMIT